MRKGLVTYWSAPASKPATFLIPGAARRQNHHRHFEAGLAPAAEDFEPVDLGQPEIEDDGVVGFGLAKIAGLLAVAGEIDRIAVVFQRLDDLAA